MRFELNEYNREDATCSFKFYATDPLEKQVFESLTNDRVHLNIYQGIIEIICSDNKERD